MYREGLFREGGNVFLLRPPTDLVLAFQAAEADPIHGPAEDRLGGAQVDLRGGLVAEVVLVEDAAARLVVDDAEAILERVDPVAFRQRGW
jgi:hypothetical protein